MGQIFDDVMNIFNGQTPIKRQNPRPGESAYYRVSEYEYVYQLADDRYSGQPAAV